MLREALSADGEAFFVTRVLAGLERSGSERSGSWEVVLAGWARVGIAAALLIAAFSGWLSARFAEHDVQLSVPESMIASEAALPQSETVVSALLGDE
jgi:hypothetical protein